jgi:rhodanese-related sulfurtransferase
MESLDIMTTDRLPTEHEEQRELVRWFRQTYKGVRIFAIPNGGVRSRAAAGRLKAEGVSAGVPDLFVPAWGLWIEMKRQKGGVVSAEQKDWINYLQSVNHVCIVGKGAEAAKAAISDFHEINEGKTWSRVDT